MYRFAAALTDLKVWVLNVVNIDSPDTLPIIYERGLFGIYHDWCESFSTYPRTYDLLHADHLFSKLKKRWDTSSWFFFLLKRENLNIGHYHLSLNRFLQVQNCSVDGRDR